MQVVGVKMRMYGDVAGEIFFIVPEKEKAMIANLAEKAMMGGSRMSSLDLSALAEIGNIMAGVYLTAIHDFCKLNIYHSVPSVSIDMFQSILDELLANMSRGAQSIIAVKNKFSIVIKSDVADVGGGDQCIPARGSVAHVRKGPGWLNRGGDAGIKPPNRGRAAARVRVVSILHSTLRIIPSYNRRVVMEGLIWEIKN